jgi:hypothetical protein
LGAFSNGAVTTADQVICTGAGVTGANEDNGCFIGEIFDVTSSNGTPVFKLKSQTRHEHFLKAVQGGHQADG